MFKIKFSSKSDQAKPIDYGPAKRRAPRAVWIFILLIACSPFFYLLGIIFANQILVRAGGFVTTPQVVIRADQNGKLIKTFVKAGDQVQQNQLLMQMVDSQLSIQQQYIEKSQAILNQYEQFKVNNLSHLKGAVNAAQSAYQFSQKNYQKVKQLHAQGAATLAEVNAAANDMYDAQQQLYTAQQNQLTEQRRFGREWDLDISNKQASINREQELVLSKMQSLWIKAPAAGNIKELYAYPEEWVKVGTPLLLLGVPTEFYIEAYLAPKRAKYAIPNRKVTIKFPNGEKIPGIITMAPSVTKPLPTEMSGALGTRDTQLLIRIKPLQPIPPKYRIDGVPVNVRIHFS